MTGASTPLQEGRQIPSTKRKAIGIRTIPEKAIMVRKKEIAATRRMEVAGMAAAEMTAAIMTTMTTDDDDDNDDDGERENQKPLG